MISNQLQTPILTKPFLKWAGGKTQLLGSIKKLIPKDYYKNQFTYLEPFVGSGAVLFWMLDEFPTLNNAIINDINSDLTNCYSSIKHEVSELIEILSEWENEYHNLVGNLEAKKEYFYSKRKLFNLRNSEQSIHSALFIFLNRTCFNGLYRVNKKNEFNVPIGSYKKPQICNKRNLLAISNKLQKVQILNGDYTETKQYATERSLFYFDPPYKPLSTTSNFNSYSHDVFDDDEQIRLRNFCATIDSHNMKWILSNSDMKNIDPNDDFFDELYSDYRIERVQARRTINSIANKRGVISELLITNQPLPKASLR